MNRVFERRGWSGAILVAAALSLAPMALHAEDRDDEDGNAPDLVLLNGKISTVDALNSTVEAIAIRRGEIIATGRSGRVRGLARRNTEVIDLHGRRVLPGLIDGHLHGLRNGYHCFTQTVRLDNVFTRTEALAKYAAKGRQLPADTWIFTTAGWTVAQLDSPGMFTLAELDAALPSNPVFIVASGAAGGQEHARTPAARTRAG
ncbi:MAG: amidohydrolase family protein, partial [Deltaproteobacteria bacterium]